MRLNRLKLVGRYKSIVGTDEQPFIYTFKPNSEGYSPICLVGLNGSGKSNFIELIADIFGYADRYFNPQYECAEDLTYDFEIDYQTVVDGHDFFIKIKSISSKVKMYSYQDIEYIDFLSFGNVQEGRFQAMVATENIDNEHERFLPDNVLAYSSGTNQGLSTVFSKSQYRFFEIVKKQSSILNKKKKLIDLISARHIDEDNRVKSDIRDLVKNAYYKNFDLFDFFGIDEMSFDDVELIFENDLEAVKPRLPIGQYTDNSLNQLFFIALSLTQSKRFKYFLDKYCNIDNLEKFEIDIRLSSYKELDFIREEITNRLVPLSSDSSRFNQETLSGVLVFDINIGFYQRLGSLYLEPKIFFEWINFIHNLAAKRWSSDEKKSLKTSHYQRNIPNVTGGLSPIRFINTEVKLKSSGEVTLYDRLSDGEHQLVQIISCMIFFQDSQSIFIFDEPDSHLNPEWRIDFIEIINKYVEVDNIELIISTHSPFILSSCKSDRVLHFKKDQDGCVAIQSVGDRETYGSSFDSLLTSVFGLEVLISKRPLDEMRDVLSKYDKGDLTNEKALKKLEKFGQSFELNYRRNKIRRTLDEEGERS